MLVTLHVCDVYWCARVRVAAVGSVAAIVPVRVCSIANAHIRQNYTTLYCANSSANVSEGITRHTRIRTRWDVSATGVKHYLMSAIIHIRSRVCMCVRSQHGNGAVLIRSEMRITNILAGLQLQINTTQCMEMLLFVLHKNPKPARNQNQTQMVAQIINNRISYNGAQTQCIDNAVCHLFAQTTMHSSRAE